MAMDRWAFDWYSIKHPPPSKQVWKIRLEKFEKLIFKFFNFFHSLLFRHLITATASVWHTKPFLCAFPWPVNSIKLFEYSPCNECHADNSYVRRYVVAYCLYISKVHPKS